MIFSSLEFIFIFLPIFLLIYYITPPKWRNITALIGSYIFYAWGAPLFVYVLLLSTIIDFILGRWMDRSRFKRRILTISIVCNIGILAYMKYANFFFIEMNHLLTNLGGGGFNFAHIALPIGISFFTFQKISYMVDIYRGKVRSARSFIDFALYIALFPQLIAGPIIRYHDVAKQLIDRIHSSEKFISGIYRFTIGLAKKVLIANPLGLTADKVWALSHTDLTTPYVWLGVLAYTFQIYFDFSGYSDMAIGLGKMMGFDFLENFNRPYLARNFTDFWRRWHISLSNWMREYLYIPLGGNRVGKRRMYLNLWIVFLLSGLWHGANWTFVVWGAYHGFFLVLDKLGMKKVTDKLPPIINTVSTFILIMFGWVFFRSETLTQAFGFITRMIIPQDIFSNILLVELINNRGIFVLVMAILLSFCPNIFYKANIQDYKIIKLFIAILTILLMILSILSLVNSGYNPFIYFRF